MKLLILGLGYSAGFVAREALSQGWEVTGTVRSADRAAESSREGVHTLVFGGFAVSKPLERMVAEADAVLVSVQPDEGRDPVLSAMAGLLAQAPNLGWIGYFSTIGVYGDHGGAWVDETTEPLPQDERSRTRLQVEREWLGFGERTGKPTQIFRLGGIYGPGRSPLAKLQAGRAKRLVKPDQVFNRIHVADISGIVMASLASPRAGAIYDVVDDLPAPPQDVVTYAAELTGIEPPPETPFDPATMTPMAASFYAENRRVSNALVKREMGYTFRYPTYREGLAALAASEGRQFVSTD